MTVDSGARPLPPREAVLRKMRRSLDPHGSGDVDPASLVERFQAGSHPWVVSGRLSAHELLQDFFSNCTVSRSAPNNTYRGSLVLRPPPVTTTLTEEKPRHVVCSSIFFQVSLYIFKGGRCASWARDGRRSAELFPQGAPAFACGRRRIRAHHRLVTKHFIF